MDTLNVTYSTIKTVLAEIPSYYVPQGDGGYALFAVGDALFIKSQIRGADTSDKADFEANHKVSCTEAASGDDALVLGNRRNNIPLVQPRLADGRLRVTAEKSTAVRQNFFSHDFTDPTTWYQKSVYVPTETAVDFGDHLSYSLVHPNVIDTYHGKVTQEDTLKDTAGHSYRVVVKVNGVTKTEQDPHPAAGGDYLMDYELGKVVFLAALAPSDVVTVTYHYAAGSTYTFAPAPGTKLCLEQAEVQFSGDIDLRDTMYFEAYGTADYFLTPAQMTAYGIPAGVGYKIQLSQFTYKAFSDFQNDAFRSYPAYPAMGDPSNWRAQKQAIQVFDWDYVASDVISSTKGMEIRMRLQHDVPCGGWMATATLYCTVGAET